MADLSENRSDKVLLLQDRLRTSQTLRAKIEIQAVCGATMAEGRQWRSAGRNSNSMQPGKENDPMLSVAMDHISPIVRQTHGRLRVSDWTAQITTAEAETLGLEPPDMNMKLRMAQSYHWRMLSRHNFADWYDDQVFRCVVAGTTLGRWRFDDNPDTVKQSLGVELDYSPMVSASTDTTNVTEDLWQHWWFVASEVVSAAQCNADYEWILKAKGAYPLKSSTKAGEIGHSDVWVNTALAQQVTGYAESESPAVIRHEMYDDKWKHLTIIIFCPSWKGKDGEKRDASWHIVFDGPWEYGCPYLKLDMLKRTTCAYGQSLAVHLTPLQNLINLMSRSKARGVILQALAKVLVVQGSVDPAEEAKLQDNEVGGLIHIRGDYKDVRTAVSPITFPRSDNAATEVMQDAMSAMYRNGTVEGAAFGQTQPRQSGRSQQMSLNESLVPLDAVSDRHRHRVEQWITNMHEAVLRHHGLGSPRKVAVQVFGSKYAGILAQRPSIGIRPVVEAGPIKVHMRDAAFKPETVESIESRFDRWMTAGHVPAESFDELMRNFFLLTGKEMKAGQREGFDAAVDIVAGLLRGEPVDIGPYDDHAFIIWICEKYLRMARLRGYTIAQKQSLELAIDKCEQQQFVAAAHKASIAGLAQGVGQAGSGAGGAQSGGETPSGGAPAEASGMMAEQPSFAPTAMG